MEVTDYLIKLFLVVVLIVVKASAHLITLGDIRRWVVILRRTTSLMICLILPTVRQLLPSKLSIELRPVQAHVILVCFRGSSCVLACGIVT